MCEAAHSWIENFDPSVGRLVVLKLTNFNTNSLSFFSLTLAIASNRIIIF